MDKISTFCYVCLRKKKVLLSLNDLDEDNIRLLDKLTCICETVWLDCQFPTYICNDCYYKLKIAYEFKEECLKNNNIIKGYVTRLKDIENIPENSDDVVNVFQNAEESDEENTEELNVMQKLETGQSTHTSAEVNTKSDSDLTAYLKLKYSPKLNSTKTYPTKNNNSKNFHSVVSKSEKNLEENKGSSNLDSETSEFVFFCPLCNKDFSRNFSLKRHMLSHTDERKFSCRICDKSFVHKSTLNIHVLSHTGEKKYVCEICQKRFVVKTHLDVHKVTHTGKKSYPCPICGKKYGHKSNVYRHLSIHTEEKPFQCEFCKKRFRQKTSLLSHEALHNSAK